MSPILIVGLPATSFIGELSTDFEKEELEIQAETKYDNARRYWLRVSESDFDGRALPDVLVNRYRKKSYIECQTIELMKLNQRIEDSHQEVVLMSDKTIQNLLDNIRGEIPALFRVCESVAMLDMIAGFCQLATAGDEYVKPEIADCLAIKSGRHPIREKVSSIPGTRRMQLALTANRFKRTRSSSLTTSLHPRRIGFRS
jgi:DNA mismatch repair protein MSH4